MKQVKKENTKDIASTVVKPRKQQCGDTTYCNTKDKTDLFQKVIQEKLQYNYTVSSAKTRQPRIKITNFKQDMTLQETETAICSQNNLNVIKVTFIRSNQNGNNTIFCECWALCFEGGEVYRG